jgi:hypothetical protein
LLFKERDKSQIFLIGVFFLMPLLAYFMARIIWDYYRYKLIINDVGTLFVISLIIEIILLVYLGYWIWKAVKSK